MQRPSPRAGMSMLEVMIAMTVMTVALMAVFGAMGSAHQANEFSRTRNQVMSEFQKAAERIQASAAIYTSTTQTPFVTATASSFDVAAGTGSSLAPWVMGSTSQGSTTQWSTPPPLVTVRPKAGVVGMPAHVMPLVITVQWNQDNSNHSASCDYYYAPRP